MSPPDSSEQGSKRERLTKYCFRVWLVGVYFSREKTRCRGHGKEQSALVSVGSHTTAVTEGIIEDIDDLLEGRIDSNADIPPVITDHGTNPQSRPFEDRCDRGREANRRGTDESSRPDLTGLSSASADELLQHLSLLHRQSLGTDT